jgi:hypothetical protein
MNTTKLVAVILLSSFALVGCRGVQQFALAPTLDNYSTICESKLEFRGTLAISGKPNVLFSDILTLARSKFGSEVSISNVRSRVNYKKIFGLSYAFEEEVLFDVYTISK